MASLRHVGTNMRHAVPTGHISAMKVLITLLAVVKVSRCAADDNSAHDSVYFDQLYLEGVKAYTDQLWYKCAYKLESAVNEYRNFKKTLTDCRLNCKNGDQKSRVEQLGLPAELGELSVYKAFLQHADCYRRCKSDAFVLRPGLRLSKDLEAVFKSRKLYQYLQFCWYKLDRLKLAASASYTFYLANPEDEDVKRNIAFYRDKAKVPESDFIDLELVPYKESYIRAMLSHNAEDWEGVVEHLEVAIKEFFVEEERCRADCEDDMDTSLTSHFTGVIADHFLHVLECQLGCERNLSVVYSEPIENFLSEQFHFLQYAYYKLEKIAEAVEATASFLLFFPDDEIVKDNKRVFKKRYDYSEDQFIARGAVKNYVERRQKLQSVYDFLQENFMKDVPDVEFKLDATDTSQQDSDNVPKRSNDQAAWMDRYERLGLHVIAKEKDLHRPYRFAADGLLKQDQCEDLLALMKAVPMDKKGVQTFTLKYAREAVIEADEDYEASLRFFMRATEVMRHYTQRYYNLTESLFFKNTSIVCWQQVPDPDVESDCIPQEFGTCDPESKVKESTLVEDEFVTVTYLSSLEDGDVFFLGENVTIDTSLGVKYGRTVGFQSGDRHGLHIPQTNTRCGLVNTYTTYPSESEKEYTETNQILQRLENVRMEHGMLSYKDVMKRFEDMGVRVVKNGTTLNGEERVVIDGLASEAECMSLKNMVMDLGKAGDGYGGHSSPHTKNELFAGLNLKNLCQSGALVGDGYDHLETKPSYISPHTEHELFQGLTIYRAAKLMHMGLVNTFSMRSFLDISEKSRLFTEKYFNLTRPLYFDFTHLVCRSAIDESKERDDLSHPVHADNCILQPDGSCIKEYPAFVQRDYSAIVYLNDDFEGGDFFFAYSNKTEQSSIHPKCGRMVGFNAKEFHGVKAVRSGVRCALALWFTLNPNFKELAHIHAKKVLKSIQAERDAQEQRLETLAAQESQQSQDHSSQEDEIGNGNKERKTSEKDSNKSNDEVAVSELHNDDVEKVDSESDLVTSPPDKEENAQEEKDRAQVSDQLENSDWQNSDKENIGGFVSENGEELSEERIVSEHSVKDNAADVEDENSNVNEHDEERKNDVDDDEGDGNDNDKIDAKDEDGVYDNSDLDKDDDDKHSDEDDADKYNEKDDADKHNNKDKDDNDKDDDDDDDKDDDEEHHDGDDDNDVDSDDKQHGDIDDDDYEDDDDKDDGKHNDIDDDDDDDDKDDDNSDHDDAKDDNDKDDEGDDDDAKDEL